MGMSALAPNEQVRPEHLEVTQKIFGSVGETVEVEEAMMDAVTAVSGSGPGFIFRIMECLVEAGVAIGLPRETTYRLVVQMTLGAAYLARESDESLARLREMVTSPGGTTAAGLAVFEKMGLQDMVSQVIKAAHERGIELGSK
jgi:pyrroline-5-carboxylate reductase